MVLNIFRAGNVHIVHILKFICKYCIYMESSKYIQMVSLQPSGHARNAFINCVLLHAHAIHSYLGLAFHRAQRSIQSSEGSELSSRMSTSIIQTGTSSSSSMSPIDRNHSMMYKLLRTCKLGSKILFNGKISDVFQMALSTHRVGYPRSNPMMIAHWKCIVTSVYGPSVENMKFTSSQTCTGRDINDRNNWSWWMRQSNIVQANLEIGIRPTPHG